jgi:hypothetical protein
LARGLLFGEQGPVVVLGSCLVDLVECGVGTVRTPVHRVDLQAAQAAPEPGALDIGEVSDEAEQGQRGRLHRAHRQLLTGQSRALAK